MCADGVSSGSVVGPMGAFSHVLVAAAVLRNGSKPMALIGLPNVPPVFLIPILVLLSLHRRTLHGDVRAIYPVDRLVYTYPRSDPTPL